MKKNKLGFTLVELLSVVLIIGVLTSIALPQYRRSISRAEAMEAIVNLRTIYDSARRFRAASSQAPTRLQGLDVSFFDASSDTDSSFEIGKFTYQFDTNKVSACRTGGNYCFHMYYLRSYSFTPENSTTPVSRNSKGDLFCTFTPGGKYDWLCEALGSGALSDTEFLIEQ